MGDPIDRLQRLFPWLNPQVCRDETQDAGVPFSYEREMTEGPEVDVVDRFIWSLARLAAPLPYISPFFHQRVSDLDDRVELIRNHDDLEHLNPHRPIAVVISTVSDWNGAFSGGRSLRALLDSDDFHVVYYEVDNEAEAEQVLRNVTDRTGRRIHTLVLEGHGSSSSLQLGNGPGEQEYIDVEDFRSNPDFLGLNDVLEEDGQILLYACSNGQGGGGADNLASWVSFAARGRAVFSMDSSDNFCSIVVDPISLGLSLATCNGARIHRFQRLQVEVNPHERPVTESAAFSPSSAESAAGIL